MGKAREIFELMPDYIRRSSSACINAMISCYAKNGQFEEAWKLLKGLPQRDSLSCNSLLSGYVYRGEIGLAAKFFFSGEIPMRDLVSWNLMLAGFFRAGDIDGALKLFQQFPRQNVVSFVTMITGLCQFGMLEEARKIFDRMPEKKSVVAWNAMISGYISSGKLDEALPLFNSMPEKNLISFSAMISGLAGVGKLAEAKSLLCEMPRQSPAAETALLSGYARIMDMDEARKIFDQMMNKDSVAWNAMISGYACSGKMEDARDLFDQMPERDVVSFNVMVSGYLRQGAVDCALELFDRITEGDRDVVSWNSIISGLAQNGMFEEAMDKMIAMIRSSKKPDWFTISSGISVCGNLATLRSGEMIHGLAVKCGVSGDSATGNALVAMYGRCGDVAEASRVFAEMKVKDVISFNSLISTLAMNGRSKEAVEVFNDMIKDGGIVPDEVTFVGVLSACSHGGLVEEGLEIFSCITKPVAEHYACMVDLLARAERMEEAMEMVKNMEVEPTASVWGAILSGCRLHWNPNLAGIAARALAALEEERIAGNYVGLCNVAAEEGRWEDVERMRRGMREKKVKKEMGRSWIEVNGKVSAFVAGDLRGSVLWVLQSLTRQIKIEAELVVNRRFDFCAG